MDSQESVMEGFLCPICIADLKSPAELSAHFEIAHADDKVVYQQLKSVFSKAKRKILKDSDTVNNNNNDVSKTTDVSSSSKVNISNGKPSTGGIDLSLWEKQTVGSSFSHMDVFRLQRKEAIESLVVETNKLIIRLGKLITSGIYASDSSLPTAIKTRRNVERSVVPWDSDDKAKVCLNCSKKFSLMYRRHHCRLCGKVICEECLDSLDMNLACSVLKMDMQTASAYIKFPTEDSDKENNGLKLCDPCNLLLIRQNKLIQDKSANSNLLQLYEKVQVSIKETNIIQPKYLKTAESLIAGETEFSLEAATELRFKLLKSYESIEALSKRMLNLGMDKEKQPSPQLQKLQRSIRQYASNYLTQNMFILPALPTAEKYAELLKQKENERKKLKAERLERSSAPNSSRSSPTMSPRRDTKDSRANGTKSSRTPIDTLDSTLYNNNNNYVSRTASEKLKASKDIRPIQAVSISKTRDSSWGPVQVATADKSTSAVTQQIEIVRGYLAQARQAGKKDEVKLFEENLRELVALDRQEKGLVAS